MILLGKKDLLDRRCTEGAYQLFQVLQVNYGGAVTYRDIFKKNLLRLEPVPIDLVEIDEGFHVIADAHCPR